MKKEDKRSCNCNIDENLKAKVDNVIIDNEGKNQRKNVTKKELTEEVEILNLDEALRDRG